MSEYLYCVRDHNSYVHKREKIYSGSELWVIENFRYKIKNSFHSKVFRNPYFIVACYYIIAVTKG